MLLTRWVKYDIYNISVKMGVGLLKKTYGFYLKQIQDSLERQANNDLRTQDLTLMQLGVLLLLNDSLNGAMSLKDLEKFFGVAQPTMAGIVKRLEQKGFVESRSSETDKRIKMIGITDHGIACCKRSEYYMEESEERLLCGLTPVEKQVFLALLQKICDTMQ